MKMKMRNNSKAISFSFGGQCKTKAEPKLMIVQNQLQGKVKSEKERE